MISSRCIESSLLHYLTTNMGATPVSSDAPMEFDPDATDKEEWLLISDISIDWSPSREATRTAQIVLRMEANSRTQNNTQAAQRLLDRAVGLVDRKVVPVFDGDSSDIPQVGFITFTEPKVKEVPRTLWQCRSATIEGTYYGTLPQ